MKTGAGLGPYDFIFVFVLFHAYEIVFSGHEIVFHGHEIKQIKK